MSRAKFEINDTKEKFTELLSVMKKMSTGLGESSEDDVSEILQQIKAFAENFSVSISFFGNSITRLKLTCIDLRPPLKRTKSVTTTKKRKNDLNSKRRSARKKRRTKQPLRLRATPPSLPRALACWAH